MEHLESNNLSLNPELRLQIEEYTKRGYVIIPLDDKSPVQKDWQNIQWNSEFSYNFLENYISFGFQISEDIVVIDVDNHDEQNIGSKSLEKLSNDFDYDFVSNAGFIVETASGGLHLYYKKPVGDFRIKNSLKDYNSIEFKSKGRQVVIPESKLSDGRSYKVDLLHNSLDDLKELPPALLSRLQTFSSIEKDKPSFDPVYTNAPCDISAFKNYLDSHPEILKGSRNNELYSVACKAKSYGLSRDSTLGILSQWQLNKVLPPVAQSELSTIIENAYNYSREAIGVNSLSNIFGKLPSPNGSLNVVNISEFLSMELPPKDYIIDPILTTQGLAMIHAARGIGKTYLSLFLSLSIAAGPRNIFDEKWKILKTSKVLYIDGEMSASQMQTRIKKFDISISDPDNFHILTPDLLEGKSMPNLSLEEDQKILEPFIETRDVIIIDNIATLCLGGKENEVESWRPVQKWILKLRACGKSVIFIHHSGKDGNQRGSSGKEDVLDTVIKLQRPEDYNSEEGARFDVIFEKTRNFAGESALPFELTFEEIEKGIAQWKVKDVANIKRLEEKEIIELYQKGHTQTQIANELGLSQPKVSRVLKKEKNRLNGTKKVFSS